MTDAEWQLVADDVLGLWGSGNQQIVDRRLAAMRKRFQVERLSVMQTAVKQLEMHAAHWPPMKDFHAAVDQAKARTTVRGYSPTRTRDASPLGPGDCIEIAGHLVSAANERVRSGRGTEGDGWHSYLMGLAHHYEFGADELRAGRGMPWPPPGIPPLSALMRVFRNTEREDRADAQRRRDWFDDSRDDGPAHSPSPDEARP